jgi:hypothetical protein
MILIENTECEPGNVNRAPRFPSSEVTELGAEGLHKQVQLCLLLESHVTLFSTTTQMCPLCRILRL